MGAMARLPPLRGDEKICRYLLVAHRLLFCVGYVWWMLCYPMNTLEPMCSGWEKVVGRRIHTSVHTYRHEGAAFVFRPATWLVDSTGVDRKERIATGWRCPCVNVKSGFTREKGLSNTGAQCSHYERASKPSEINTEPPGRCERMKKPLAPSRVVPCVL